MRMVLVGGAPGVGKTAAARRLLDRLGPGSTVVQWVDVDALWMHAPWTVNDHTRAMVEANLAAVLLNAERAGIDLVLVTWVFQSPQMHALVRSLAPSGTSSTTVQLLLGHAAWQARFTHDPHRTGPDQLHQSRWAQAQQVPADHVISTDGLSIDDVADGLLALLR